MCYSAQIPGWTEADEIKKPGTYNARRDKLSTVWRKVFGLLHLLNHGATLLGAGAITIEGGIMLATAYMLTRRLWLCIGIHIAWNFVQGGVFSGAVSGSAQPGLLRARMVGPDWITGGSFGAEASVVALEVCAAAGIVLLVVAKRNGQIVQPYWNR